MLAGDSFEHDLTVSRWTSIRDAMGTTDNKWPTDVENALQSLAIGHEFSVPEVTFCKITDDERDKWKTQFAGQ